MDKNDNFPVFEKQLTGLKHNNSNRDNRKSKNMGLKGRNEGAQSDYDYEAQVYENAQPGTIILKVRTLFLSLLKRCY